MKNFACTFGMFAQFENGTLEIRDKEYHGVYEKKGTPKTPEDKSVYNCLGYFESFSDAQSFANFLFNEKNITPSFMSYNPSKGN